MRCWLRWLRNNWDVPVSALALVLVVVLLLSVVGGCSNGRIFNPLATLFGGGSDRVQPTISREVTAFNPLGWCSALAILAGIGCVFLRWTKQAVGLIGTGAALVVLNLTLQTHQTLIGWASVIIGGSAAVLVLGQYLGLWTVRRQQSKVLAHELANGATPERKDILRQTAEVLGVRLPEGTPDA